MTIEALIRQELEHDYYVMSDMKINRDVLILMECIIEDIHIN